MRLNYACQAERLLLLSFSQPVTGADLLCKPYTRPPALTPQQNPSSKAAPFVGLCPLMIMFERHWLRLMNLFATHGVL